MIYELVIKCMGYISTFATRGLGYFLSILMTGITLMIVHFYTSINLCIDQNKKNGLLMIKF